MGETDDFEWDDGKDEANLVKHGMPLRFGVLLFDDPYLVLIESTVSKAEPRLIAVGRVGERVLACVYSLRGARKRLISLRVARRSERRVYSRQVEQD
jgi:uncharacterized DUF497 family protein